MFFTSSLASSRLKVSEKMQTVWFFVCFVFAFHGLYSLVKEGRETLYERHNKTEDVQRLACEKLADLYPDKREIDLVELRDDLYRHFNGPGDSDWKRRYPDEFKRLILNQTKTGGYLSLNGSVCLIANNWTKLRDIRRFLSHKAMYFAIKRETFDLVKMQNWNDQIDQLVVLRKAHPYTNCDKSNSRFFCLNNCFKRKARLARYFYSGDETEPIQLNYDERNATIKANEKICFDKCRRENCKMVQLIAIKKNSRTETLKARPKLRKVDYWIQFIGLVCSFAGLSIYELISITIEFIVSKVRRRRRREMRIALSLKCLYLKWTIIFLFLTFFGYLSTQRILKYKEEGSNPAEKEARRLIQPSVVRLAICLNIRNYIGYRYEDMTMLEIERATDRVLNDLLNGIYTNYLDRLFKADYQVHPKVLFKGETRCFRLSIYPNYQTEPSNPKLTIKFKKDILYEVYLLSKNENLNVDSFEHSGQFAFQKRIVKRLRSSGKCVDYAEKYTRNCTSRSNCIERCIQRRFIERFNRTTFGLYRPFPVIDRDWFSSTEWNTSHLMKIGHHYDSQKMIYISSECSKKIPDEQPCNEIKFELTVETRQPEIDLQFDVERSVEESPSWYKLTLDLLNLQSIFFGFTVLQLLRFIFNFAQRDNKIVWLLIIYLLCSIGASWHTYHIFDLIIRGELVPTSYYELAKQIEMPEMVFCYQIDKKIDKRMMFSNITHLNESNDWMPFDLDQVKRFSLVDSECFRFKIDQVYHRNQFHFSTENQILNVNLTLFAKRKDAYFMTKNSETAEFSKVVYLDYSRFFYKYSITHETSLYKYDDRFGFIRKHFSSSFQKEDDGDFDGQRVANSSRPQRFVTNHLSVRYKGQDFTFSLAFLQKIVFSTNEENLGMLVLSLLNVLFIWFDLALLDLYPISLLFCDNLYPVILLLHDHLLLPLYRHLPFSIYKWLKKFAFPFYELLKLRTPRGA